MRQFALETSLQKLDGNGKYQFDALELGTYTMAVSKPGYQAFSGEVTIER